MINNLLVTHMSYRERPVAVADVDGRFDADDAASDDDSDFGDAVDADSGAGQAVNHDICN